MDSGELELEPVPPDVYLGEYLRGTFFEALKFKLVIRVDKTCVFCFFNITRKTLFGISKLICPFIAPFKTNILVYSFQKIGG